MLYFVLKRLLSAIPVVALVALFVFSLLYFSPGDPAVAIAGDQASPDVIARIRHDLGLDQPFFPRLLSWVGGIVQGDFGVSLFSRQPVLAMIAQRVEPTLSLMVFTLIIAVLLAVPLGVLAAWKAGATTDRLVMGFAIIGFSVPVFVIGYMLAYTFSLQLRWLPVQGYKPIAQGVGPWIRSLVLPSITLGCVYIALIARITRATVIETLQQDYIRTARAKGVAWRRLLFVHALKNASVPIVTVIGLGVGLLIGGAVVTESVFAIPGLGRLTVDSVLRRDYPVIQAIVMLFSLSYVLVNLLIDLTYVFLDPRIRY